MGVDLELRANNRKTGNYRETGEAEPNTEKKKEVDFCEDGVSSTERAYPRFGFPILVYSNMRRWRKELVPETHERSEARIEAYRKCKGSNFNKEG